MLGNYDGVCSVTAKEAYKKAQEIHSNLKATHCGFGGCTLVRDDDAFIFIESSFVEDLGNGYFGVFTEHHGFHFHHEDEATVISLQRVKNDWWEHENQ